MSWPKVTKTYIQKLTGIYTWQMHIEKPCNVNNIELEIISQVQMWWHAHHIWYYTKLSENVKPDTISCLGMSGYNIGYPKVMIYL